MLAMPDGRDACEAAGIDMIEFATDEIPRGYWEQTSEALGRLSGRAAVRFTVDQYCKTASVLMTHIPGILRDLQPDGMLIDQTYTAVVAVADHLQLPYVSVCGALPMNAEPGVPPIVLDWPYRETSLARIRNRLGHLLFQRVTSRVRHLINAQRIKWNLPINNTIDDTFSTLAQIGQIPRAFDFPRNELPECFHYVGPLHDTGTRADIPFPYDRLDGGPLIYASMGTLQNRIDRVFQTIAEANTMTDLLDPRSAVYVGSFDPLTLGHLDIIRRGARLFERLTVGIGVNPEKRPLFSPDERLSLTQKILADLPNVTVACFEGLAVNFAQQNNAAVMLRGIRTLTDIESEFTMSLANRALAKEIETVFLMSSEKYTHISSSLIKQIAQLGGGDDSADRLKSFVPEEIIPGLVAKYA
eukprot:g12561.t1